MSDRLADRVDTLFAQLAHPRRRGILCLVAAAPDGIDLRTVATTIYAVEHGVTPATAPTREVTNLRTNLRRSHLDGLANAGLIEVAASDTLVPGPNFGWALALLALGFIHPEG